MIIIIVIIIIVLSLLLSYYYYYYYYYYFADRPIQNDSPDYMDSKKISCLRLTELFVLKPDHQENRAPCFLITPPTARVILDRLRMHTDLGHMEFGHLK